MKTYCRVRSHRIVDNISLIPGPILAQASQQPCIFDLGKIFDLDKASYLSTTPFAKSQPPSESGRQASSGGIVAITFS